MSNKCQSPKDLLYTLSTLLDAIGPEASLGREAWNEISTLDLRNQEGVRFLIRKYLLPEYSASPEVWKLQYCRCLEEFITIDHELENFPMEEYPYLEATPPRLFFTTLAEELLIG